jgi:hypothetical protein
LGPNARKTLKPFRSNAKIGGCIYHGLFQAMHEFGYALPPAPQIANRIDHYLARAVVRYLAAPVNLVNFHTIF